MLESNIYRNTQYLIKRKPTTGIDIKPIATEEENNILLMEMRINRL